MKSKINTFISFFFIVILLTVFHGTAFSQSLEIKQISEAYIGQPIAFEVAGEFAQDDRVNFEWAFSDNVTSILLSRAGRSSSFVVLNTSPVALSLRAVSEEGEVLAETFLTTAAQEFDVEIRLMPVTMRQMWNLETRAEETAEEFAANQRLSFEAIITPELRDSPNYIWRVSEGVSFDLSEGGKRITVWRRNPGICFIEVEIANRSGVFLGKGTTYKEIVIPDFAIVQSENRKRAWEKWNEALKTWDESGFMNVEGYEKALELALEALAINSDDYKIIHGAEKMEADNASIQRAKQFALEGDAQREIEKWTESLAAYRRSLAIWHFTETEKAISEVEEIVRAIRLDRERASWLRDMANAYEEEKRYEDAIRLFRESLLLDRQEIAIRGIERVENLLRISQTTAALRDESEELILSGNYSAAVDKLREILALQDNGETRQKLREVEYLISALRAKASQLRREGNEHARRGRNAEALASFIESKRTWSDAAAEELVRRFEGLVPEDRRLPEATAEAPPPERNPDAERLLNEGTEFYRAGNYEEAINRYRKSYAFEANSQLMDWIGRIEGSMRAQASINESNRLIRQGNALYSIRRYNEALESYMASLELYPNIEVENFIRHIKELLN